MTNSKIENKNVVSDFSMERYKMLKRNFILITLLLFSLHLIFSSEVKAGNNENGSIGVSLIEQDQNITLEFVFTNCPAEKAGLQTGDIILQINGQSARGITLQEAVKRISGPVGSKVQLLIKSSEGKSKTVDITRAKIEYGAKSQSDYFGQFRFLDQKETFVSLKKLPNGYVEITCEKENWRGIGSVYRNPNYKTFHYKGVFQMGDSSDVQKEMRGVVGYFQVECVTGNAFNLIRKWSIVNDEATLQKTPLVKVNSESSDSQ